MIDIHNHLLINTDDGPTSKAEARDLLKQAEGQGITDVMITPHHHAGFHYTPKGKVFSKIETLHDIIEAEGLSVNVHHGQEIRINEHIMEELRDGLSTTLNDTDYILIELPFDALPPYYEAVLDELIDNGYTPIIAHPERCRPIAQNPDILRPLVQKGVITQVTAGSITGDFGPALQKTGLRMIEDNLIHVVASDAHHAENRPFRMPAALDIIKSEFGEVQAEAMQENAWKIFNDEKITSMVAAKEGH